MTTCPKCGYQRTQHDTAPDYECPACGIVYAKYKAAQSAASKAAEERKLQEAASLRARARKQQEAEDAEADLRIAAAKQALAELNARPKPESRLRKALRPSFGAGLAIVVFALWAITPKPPPQTRPAARPEPVAQTPAEKPAPTAEELQAEADRKEESRRSSAARAVCRAAIMKNATYPSTVDVHEFWGTAVDVHRERAIVRMDFDAKNALGNELPYTAFCSVAANGTLESFVAKAR